MEKEEFRNMLLDAIDEDHHHEVEAWLENAERGFERIADAMNWPVEQIRDFYKLIGFEIKVAQAQEDIGKQ
ncbi:hypothetical protein [Sphingobacterium corticibacterium]|uniref:Uncharacterized protein n=1 Tax=Sphingobacterium corticibacterium TaxID=2484746 RepID=A0A4Q6XK43_9SPHI|nr:hypothetical protein [Sphingobacterium corticibacterium]RZF60251.1 hypothetical protein EWE74_14180 [Sphingobacterium corticibacterium]